MTLALRLILCGILFAAVAHALLPFGIWAMFLAYCVGMVTGLALSWFCWPWDGSPEDTKLS